MRPINSISDWILQKSCKLGVNIIDWIRSVYFSLLGSSVLNQALKAKSLSSLANIIYFFALAFLGIGLLLSVKITNRLKALEKDFDKSETVNRNTVTLPEFCAGKENDNKIQYIGLWTIWIPAILCIGYAGLDIEGKAAQSGQHNKNLLQEVNVELKAIKSILIKNDSLSATLKTANQSNIKLSRENDSLKKVLHPPKKHLRNNLVR